MKEQIEIMAEIIYKHYQEKNCEEYILGDKKVFGDICADPANQLFIYLSEEDYHYSVIYISGTEQNIDFHKTQISKISKKVDLSYYGNICKSL